MSDMLEDFEVIRAMLKRAHECGMLVEVVDFFGRDRATGASVEDAARYALREWDC